MSNVILSDEKDMGGTDVLLQLGSVSARFSSAPFRDLNRFTRCSENSKSAFYISLGSSKFPDHIFAFQNAALERIMCRLVSRL